jgi:hypothetical protein
MLSISNGKDPNTNYACYLIGDELMETKKIESQGVGALHFVMC